MEKLRQQGDDDGHATPTQAHKTSRAASRISTTAGALPAEGGMRRKGSPPAKAEMRVEEAQALGTRARENQAMDARAVQSQAVEARAERPAAPGSGEREASVGGGVMKAGAKPVPPVWVAGSPNGSQAGGAANPASHAGPLAEPGWTRSNRRSQNTAPATIREQAGERQDIMAGESEPGARPRHDASGPSPAPVNEQDRAVGRQDQQRADEDTPQQGNRVASASRTRRAGRGGSSATGGPRRRRGRPRQAMPTTRSMPAVPSAADSPSTATSAQSRSCAGSAAACGWPRPRMKQQPQRGETGTGRQGGQSDQAGGEEAGGRDRHPVR